MRTKRQQFYHSEEWLNLIRLLRVERARDGVLYCEECGRPILRAYDCIAHHDTELTEDNVDDVTVSLNPENIKLLHFRCHNAVHHRFGYKPCKTVNLIYGAPCAGTTTYGTEIAESGDIIYDIDKLWQAIRADVCGDYEKPNELKACVFALRDTLLDNIKTRFGKWNSAYIIGGYPLVGERERLIDSLGIDKVVLIDTPKEICLERAKLKGEAWTEYVERWFEMFTP